MSERPSDKTYRQNHRANQWRRKVDRYHGCKCGEIFACDPCSEALTQSVRRNADQGVKLYALECGDVPDRHFLCPKCRRHYRRKKAA